MFNPIPTLWKFQNEFMMSCFFSSHPNLAGWQLALFMTNQTEFDSAVLGQFWKDSSLAKVIINFYFGKNKINKKSRRRADQKSDHCTHYCLVKYKYKYKWIQIQIQKWEELKRNLIIADTTATVWSKALLRDCRDHDKGHDQHWSYMIKKISYMSIAHT